MSRLYRPLGLSNADWARLKKQAAARRARQDFSASPVPTHELDVWEGEGGYVPADSRTEAESTLPIGSRR